MVNPQPEVISLSQKLIRRKSVTPDDDGCQQVISHLLSNSGFEILHQRIENVDNFFAWHGENNGVGLLFVGHTDVVPSGDEKLWESPPFAAELKKGELIGRGAADMKSSVAAFVLAAKNFVIQFPQHKGKLAVMLTSDEEGEAINGIQKFMPIIAKQHHFDFCLVGEPSSSETLGDIARIGRRGSLHVQITIHGKQGHVAYPENAVNPVFIAADFISDLSKQSWDKGNEDFPPTSFQISSVRTSTNVSNIIPGDLIIEANFRYSPESSEISLVQQIRQLLEKHSLKNTIKTNLSGKPFHSTSKRLKNALSDAIRETVQKDVEFNTAGGTSDGRFIAPFGIDVVEFGLINKTIHQINERVDVDDIVNLEKIYFKVIENILNK